MSTTAQKIVLYDTHESDSDFYEQALGRGWQVVCVSDGLTSDTVHFAHDAQVIAMHVTSHVTAALMEQMPQLRHVAARSTGYDHIDLTYTRSHDITVSTVPTYGENTVAEYAFMLLLAVARKLMLAAHSVHVGYVTTQKLTGHDLEGRTLGVIGTGRIGCHAAQIAKGFGMTVVAYDPFPNEKAATEIGMTYVALDKLYAEADYISLHAPATKDTYHLIDSAAIAKMKPGIILVNTARGTLIDTPALIDGLHKGQIAAAGLDVLEGEEYLQLADEVGLLSRQELGPEAKQVLAIDVLSKMPNVLITSHNAYNSYEALHRIRTVTVDNVKAWAAGHPQNLVS